MTDDSGPPPSLQKVRAACKKRGATGVKGLSRLFMASFILISMALSIQLKILELLKQK